MSIYQSFKTGKIFYVSNFTISEHQYWLPRTLAKQAAQTPAAFSIRLPDGSEVLGGGFSYKHDKLLVAFKDSYPEKAVIDKIVDINWISKDSSILDFMLSRLSEKQLHRLFKVQDGKVMDPLFRKQKKSAEKDGFKISIDSRLFPLFKLSPKIITKHSRLFTFPGGIGVKLSRRGQETYLFITDSD